MKITLDNKEFELRYSMRMFIIYENIMKKSLNFKDLVNYTNLITLFYSAVFCTAKYNKVQFDPTFDGFINWVDDNGGERLLEEFAQWMVLKAQEDVNLLKDATEASEDPSKNV